MLLIFNGPNISTSGIWQMIKIIMVFLLKKSNKTWVLWKRRWWWLQLSWCYFSKSISFTSYRNWKAIRRRKWIEKFVFLQNENKFVENRYVQRSWCSNLLKSIAHLYSQQFLFLFNEVFAFLPQKKHWEWN